MQRQEQAEIAPPIVKRLLKAASRLNLLPLCFIVLLPIVMVTAGQAPPAQAAPAATDADIRVWLEARQVGRQRTICVGDSVDIQVKVLATISSAGNIVYLDWLSGEQVSAIMDSSGVGRISPSSMTTGWDGHAVGVAKFTFTALRPGTTAAVFQAKVRHRVFAGLKSGGNTVTANTKLTVDDCAGLQARVGQRGERDGEFGGNTANPANTTLTVDDLVYKVKVISFFQAQGVNLGSELNGGFDGLATVKWTGASYVQGDCTGEITVADSKAELKGEIVEDQLAVDVIYEPAKLTNHFVCVGRNGTRVEETQKDQVQPNPMRFVVPRPNGGAAREPQILENPKFYKMTGEAIAFITKVTR